MFVLDIESWKNLSSFSKRRQICWFFLRKSNGKIESYNSYEDMYHDCGCVEEKKSEPFHRRMD